MSGRIFFEWSTGTAMKLSYRQINYKLIFTQWDTEMAQNVPLRRTSLTKKLNKRKFNIISIRLNPRADFSVKWSGESSDVMNSLNCQ